MELVVRMISDVFLDRNLLFIPIFYPNFRQYQIKSALFTSRNSDFSALSRCGVLVHWHGLQERFGSFQTQRRNCVQHSTTVIVETIITFFIWKHGPPARPARRPSN